MRSMAMMQSWTKSWKSSCAAPEGGARTRCDQLRSFPRRRESRSDNKVSRLVWQKLGPRFRGDERLRVALASRPLQLQAMGEDFAQNLAPDRLVRCLGI